MSEVALNLKQTFELALRYHHANSFSEAAQLYERILKVNPEYVEVLHSFGVLEAQRGNITAGILSIRKAVELHPDFPAAFANLGRLLAMEGFCDDAVMAYSRVTQLQPNNSDAYFNLGVALQMKGDSEDALRCLRRCVELNPSQGEAHNELGHLFFQSADYSQAVMSFSTAVKCSPQNAEARNNLGNVWLKTNQFQKAIDEYIQAINLNPSNELFHTNLGIALGRKSRHVEAIQAFDYALSLNPKFMLALHGKGRALAALQRFDDAVTIHEHAVNLAPGDVLSHKYLGETLTEKGDVARAERSFRTALETDPNSSDSLKGLAIALAAMGRFNEATDCLRRVLELQPDSSDVYGHLITIQRQESKFEIEALNKILSSPTLAVDDRISAAFALGKLYDDDDRFDDAFPWFRCANTLFRQQCAADGDQFVADEVDEQVTHSISFFSSTFFCHTKNWGVADNAPVFVVGMPRSGTTLVEQIAASHSKIFGAGELRGIPAIRNELIPSGLPAVDLWTKDRVFEISESHLNHLKLIGGGAHRVIDKLPGNIMNLGLIATLFPHARVIVCHRDPRDNCLSCYFQRFRQNNLLYSYDLKDCATQYLEQQRLLAHWTKALPLQMMTMQYEQLVADLEGQSRRLIEFLGLDWEPACLDFHKTERTVLTASVWQVRQPIYTRSVGRWKNYKSHLGPLLDALQMNP